MAQVLVPMATWGRDFPSRFKCVIKRKRMNRAAKPYRPIMYDRKFI
jgi:hypothetical protein